MLEISETPAYAEWFVALRGRTARARDDKSSQDKDICLANDLARNL
jgi:hypothetical protein